MRLTSAAVLALLAALAASAAGHSQRFCYKRVGYTRKRAEQQLPATDGPCQGDSCELPAAATRYKTEVFYRTERHCCAGHQMSAQSPDWCTPVCSRGCPQGEACTAPDRCECVEGRHRDSEGRCIAVSTSLLGQDLRTLQEQLLSYISSLLDSVKSLVKQQGDYGLGHASDSTPAALEGNSTSSWEASGVGRLFSSGCVAAGALERPWSWNSSRSACLLLPSMELAAAHSC